MKVRNGFVSNSSSSSFIIKKSAVSEFQLELIKNHIEVSNLLDIEKFKYANSDDRWYVDDDYSYDMIRVSTHMDNFDMKEYLINIGISEDDIEWNDY